MKLSSFGLLAGLSATGLAQDLLFLEGLDYQEFSEAEALGFTTKSVSEAEWAAMTTEDFSKFKAIVVPDPSCGSVSTIKFLEDSKANWSPAVTGNIILIGTDPSYHFGQGKAKTLIDNSIKFAAAGTTPAGVPQTGLYFSLSCYYEDEESAKVDALSYFGDFTVRGNLDCYNKVHIVASSDAMDSLDDASLSDWSCSVHEAFSSYPSVGTNGFQAMAIAQDILGVGSQDFGDGTVGLPYIISRGATPAKCGDGVWDEKFGEECDDGNLANGDGCSLSCKCESGLPKGDGTCYPSNTTIPSGPTGSGYSHPPTGYPTSYPSPTGHYYNATSSPVYSPSGYPTDYPSGYPSEYPSGHESYTPPPYATPTYYPSGYPTSYAPPPYVTPSCPTSGKIIGVEYIIEVTYTDSSYVPCSTKARPIYDVPTSVLPCYACALETEHVTYTSTDFITVETTTCTETDYPVPTTYAPPVVYPCKTCKPHTFTETECIYSGTTVYPEYTPIDYVTPTPHVHTTVYTSAHVCENCTPGYVTSLVTYPVPTATGKYYPSATTTGVVYYTGAAVPKEVKAAGVVGGALVAVLGLL